MKKAVIILSAVVVLLAGVLIVGAVANSRKLDTNYSLSFEGTTAICEAMVLGEEKTDFIQVTVTLKQGDTVLKSWYKEGYFQFEMKETYAGLEAGKLYTLEISSILNGEKQPLVTTKRTLIGSTVPTTKPTVPTTQPTAPTTQPTVPTTQPTVPPTTHPSEPTYSADDGNAIIFRGPPFGAFYPEWYPREGLIDHLYWAVESTGECILVCDEPVIYVAKNDTHIFFVKKSAPSKVYATTYSDLEEHKLVCESTYGDISYMGIESDLQGFLQFVAENKKFVILDLTTSESTLLMEQDYITYAWLFGTGDGGTWSEIIEFEGRPTGEASGGIFTYNYVTGKLGRGDS